MAWVGSHTGSISTGRSGGYYLKELLKTAGWSVRSSGDGLSAYSASGDVITSAGSGAGGMNNTSSWFVMHKTCGLTLQKREFSFQNSSTHGNIAVFDSHTASFTGGTPGAARRPSSTDEQAVKGGGTDASPSYQAWFAATPTGHTLHVMADDDSASFYCFSTISTLSPGGAALGLDILSVGASDPDPYAWLRQTTSARWSAPNQNRTNYIGWNGRGTASEAWKVFGIGGGGYRGLAGDTDDNPWTGAWQIFPHSVADAYTSPGSTLSVFKGHSRLWGVCGHPYASASAEDYMATCLDVDSTRDWMTYTGRAMPWDGTSISGGNPDQAGERVYFNLNCSGAYVPSAPTATPPTPTRTRAAMAAKAPTMKKVPRIVPGKDPALTVAIEPIRVALNQMIDLPLNQARVLAGVDLNDSVETEVPHSLGRKPVGVIPFNVRGALSTESGGRIDLIPQRNETRSVVLMAVGHGATVTVDLLVF